MFKSKWRERNSASHLTSIFGLRELLHFQLKVAFLREAVKVFVQDPRLCLDHDVFFVCSGQLWKAEQLFNIKQSEAQDEKVQQCNTQYCAKYDTCMMYYQMTNDVISNTE